MSGRQRDRAGDPRVVDMAVEMMGVVVPATGASLAADVAVPDRSGGVVVFAHGSGSSRFSARNRFVAGRLQDSGLTTVLADLLTADEDRRDQRTGELRFDIGLLAGRVVDLVDWVGAQSFGGDAPIGLFGASTGAAAALIAAARRPDAVVTIVSRGGRPDLAGRHLAQVRQPVLLIVGGADQVVVDLNEQALRSLPGDTRLEIVPGAGHLFEEAGALERVADLASTWFGERFSGSGQPSPIR